jgi:hypothetical protein
LRVSTRSVWRWSQAGELPRVVIGGVTRFRASDIAALTVPTNAETLTANEGPANSTSDGPIQARHRY